MNTIKGIIYNCRQATFLIEKKQIGKLSVRENFELRIHLAGCSVCRLFQKQSMLINRMMKKLLQDAQNDGLSLDNDFKQSLQSKIEEKMDRESE